MVVTIWFLLARRLAPGAAGRFDFFLANERSLFLMVVPKGFILQVRRVEDTSVQPKRHTVLVTNL
jgi:hypothetical protein